MLVFESFSLFLSPVSSVLLSFAVMIICSVSFDFTLSSLDFTLLRFLNSFPVGYLYFFFARDNYFALTID